MYISIYNRSHEQQHPRHNQANSNTEVAFLAQREEQRVPMTRLRARIAERLLEAQHNAAMLTTFNEINLKAVMDLRNDTKMILRKTWC